MSIFESIILGIIQGVTEFLPISSSGHLVLFQRIFNIGKEGIAFDIMLHVATLIAVLTVFYKEAWYMIKNPLSKTTIFIIIATIPTALMGFIFRDALTYFFASGSLLGPSFILTGIVLLYADKLSKQKKYGKNIESMSYADSILIGCAQAIAIIPAISRSGSTIAMGIFRGLNKEFAIKFSFLMSIPAILGPAIFDAHNISFQILEHIGIIPLIAGMLSAGISGYLSIRLMLNLFSRASLKVFAIYVFILGGTLTIDKLFFNIIF